MGYQDVEEVLCMVFIVEQTGVYIFSQLVCAWSRHAPPLFQNKTGAICRYIVIYVYIYVYGVYTKYLDYISITNSTL